VRLICASTQRGQSKRERRDVGAHGHGRIGSLTSFGRDVLYLFEFSPNLFLTGVDGNFHSRPLFVCFHTYATMNEPNDMPFRGPAALPITIHDGHILYNDSPNGGVHEK
jgi:hypothetical protein